MEQTLRAKVRVGHGARRRRRSRVRESPSSSRCWCCRCACTSRISRRYARLLYPAVNLLLAAYLYERRSPWYAAHCLLIFCCVSLVRRLVDHQAGIRSVESGAAHAVSVLDAHRGRVLRILGAAVSRARSVRSSSSWRCIAYGTALAMLDGRIRSSLVDVLKWTVGPLFAVYLLQNRDRIAQIRSGGRAAA